MLETEDTLEKNVLMFFAFVMKIIEINDRAFV